MRHLHGFLGNTIFAVQADELYIALNSYPASQEFEDWHAHEHASISFLLNGSHKEELMGKIHKRRPGDIKFIAAGQVHRCNLYQDATRKINIELPAHLLNAMHIQEDEVERLLANHPQTKFTLLKFYQEFNNLPFTCPASLQLLLFELLRPVTNNNKHLGKTPPSWIKRLKDLLHEQLDEPLNLPVLAGILDIHPVTISRYFPHYFGTTISMYLRDIRVEKALSLIKGTQKSLTEIGLVCGFSDQSHFTHTFKKVTGFLPKEYRSI